MVGDISSAGKNLFITNNKTEALKLIFEDEIATNPNMPSNIITLMRYITSYNENFDEFHIVCGFLLSKHPEAFLIGMGVRTFRLDTEDIKIEDIKIPYNKLN